eukprot:gene6401-biopygen5368
MFYRPPEVGLCGAGPGPAAVLARRPRGTDVPALATPPARARAGKVMSRDHGYGMPRPARPSPASRPHDTPSVVLQDPRPMLPVAALIVSAMAAASVAAAAPSHRAAVFYDPDGSAELRLRLDLGLPPGARPTVDAVDGGVMLRG